MCLKIRCDEKSEKFYKIFWKLNKAQANENRKRGQRKSGKCERFAALSILSCRPAGRDVRVPGRDKPRHSHARRRGCGSRHRTVWPVARACSGRSSHADMQCMQP